MFYSAVRSNVRSQLMHFIQTDVFRTRISERINTIQLWELS
jgi:hypothetical protein